MTKITCDIEKGASITFEGVEADTVLDFLSGFTGADLTDENNSVTISDSQVAERTANGTIIRT